MTLRERFNPNRLPSPVALGRKFNREALADLFGELGFRRGAEIGVCTGLYSETLCQRNIHLEALFCIDPWTAFDGNRPNGWGRDQAAHDAHFAEATARLSNYPAVTIVRAPSIEAAKEIPDGSLDFVYIDGNHRYESVVQDIAAWSAKVRSGGIVAGHDFTTNLNKHIRVEEAVRDYVGLKCIDPWFVLASPDDVNPSWLWVKQ